MAYYFWYDSPEYQRRLKTPFEPPEITLAELRAAIPKSVFEKSTIKTLYYVGRDLFSSLVVHYLGARIDDHVPPYLEMIGMPSVLVNLVRWILWGLYWFSQSVIFTGWWALAHEAGHGNLSSIAWLNHAIGFALHTSLLVPYYNWRSTHQTHHKATNSIERDVNFVPSTRSDYGLPSESTHVNTYHDLFEETPLYTLLRLVVMQVIGWQVYLLTDTTGNPKYPPGTNMILPSSPLFKPHERREIIMSNIGVASVASLLWMYYRHFGAGQFIKLYLIPYLLVHHWVVMIVFLQHSDPSVPHYRGKTWTFFRGALCTVDRPMFGWIGRFYFHNICHDHIAHHLFSTVPFYNQPQVTQHIKVLLGDSYNYDSSSCFRALYRNFTECCFIEDDGEIVFYKNKYGRPARVLKDNVDKVRK
ncbi:delta-12 fatty acid desaturase [Lyophyllum atratum]|nr:delta-12 fatty acid desaturase [Lyophyllum atratum]